MSLMTMLGAAQGGQLFERVAESLDLDAAETRKAMTKLCPAIATKLKARAAEDDDLFASLLELIDEGQGTSPLDEPDALTDAEAISDGHAILEDVYGSRNAAMVALRKAAPDVPERELSKLGPISATAVVAALAQANRPMTAAAMPAAEPQTAAGSGEGVLGTLIGAVIAGAVQGVVRELTSSRTWRGKTSYTRSRARRAPSRSTKTSSRSKARKTTKAASSTRRTTSASIDDIFRDILGNLTK